MRLNQGVFVLVSCLLFIAACSSDGDKRRQEYLDADYYTRLELPPDLTEPATNLQLGVPKPTDATLDKFRQDTAHLGEGDAGKHQLAMLRPKLSGAELKSEAGVYWLEVDTDVEKLWPRLDAFWSHEGFKLVRNKPLLGLIETDWANKLQIDNSTGWLQRMFAHAEPDRLDKFRMRVESVKGVSKTRVYVAHSGLEKFVEEHDINWVSRCSDAELEHEMLSRLALFVGLDKAQAETVFADYQPYASRVKFSPDETSTLYITGKLDDVWKRSQRALDRMGSETQQIDNASHQIQFAITQLKREQIGEEHDEYTESSWLMKFFRSDASDQNRQFTLALSQQTDVVKVDMLTREGVPARGVLVEQYMKGLVVELQ